MRELDMLRHIYGANATLPAQVSIPPGDDMGAVQIGDTQVLVTVDQVAEGPHFLLAQTPIEKIGRKALTRNLSDVAAMAAWPVGAVAAACLPREFGQQRAQALFDSMQRTAQQYDCPLFGGDISVWDGPLLASVTVLAEPRGVVPILRQGAVVGDVVCVSGQLGGSVETVDGRAHHLDFEPRITLARALAAQCRPHAMIDLSDGLARDLGHICRASNVAATIEVDQVPVSPAAHVQVRRDGRLLWKCALGDGEDYELCFTLSPHDAAKLPDQIDGVLITKVGRINEPSGAGNAPVVALHMPDGTMESGDDLGWEHVGPATAP